jgi:hypothetical protein
MQSLELWEQVLLKYFWQIPFLFHSISVLVKRSLLCSSTSSSTIRALVVYGSKFQTKSRRWQPQQIFKSERTCLYWNYNIHIACWLHDKNCHTVHFMFSLNSIYFNISKPFTGSFYVYCACVHLIVYTYLIIMYMHLKITSFVHFLTF